MNFIKKYIISSIIVVSVFITAYLINFFNCPISNKSSDWSNFSGYISGIIMPILTALNIIIFYILMQTAAKFANENVRKQLAHSTCAEYLKIINDLSLLFLDNLDLCAESNDFKNKEIYKKRAIGCLCRISFIVDCFINETKSFIDNNNDLGKSKSLLFKSIDELKKDGSFGDDNKIGDFFEHRSNFIREIFNLIST